MSDWSSGQYMKFEKERTRPASDLIGRIERAETRRVLDLGCGPGNSTRLLAERFNNAEITGIDSSENMLARARAEHPEIRFEKCSVPGELDRIEEKFDLIFSNACIHWIPGQEELLKAVFAKLKEGGTLAVQIPMTQKAEFYKLLYGLCRREKWKRLEQVRNFHSLAPEEYYDLLSDMSRGFEMWETTYYHSVPSAAGVLEWYKGSGLRPYLALLTDEERIEFTSELERLITANYPVRKNGGIILKMPRLFFTAVK